MKPSEAEIHRYLLYLCKMQLTHNYPPTFRLKPYAPVTVCTSWAVLVAKRFKGNVYGYSIKETDSKMLIGHFDRGHDFAVVGDYIVDGWATYVEECLDFPITPLIHYTDALQYRMLLMEGKARYKPSSEWEEVKVN